MGCSRVDPGRMNINLNAFGAPTAPLPDDVELDVLSDEMDEHREILGLGGVPGIGNATLTGRMAFTPDPEDWEAGAMRVWSETSDGTWLWVDPDGEVVYTECPLHGPQDG